MQSCMQDAGMKQEAAAYLQEREQNAAYEFFRFSPVNSRAGRRIKS